MRIIFTLSVVILLSFIYIDNALAFDENWDDFKKSIFLDVQKLSSSYSYKQYFSNFLRLRDGATSGGGHRMASMIICESLGALDSQLNGLIIGDFYSDGGKEQIKAIDKHTLSTLQLMYQQCKPTNYQHWNSDSSFFYVIYSPDEEDEKIIKKWAFSK